MNRLHCILLIIATYPLMGMMGRYYYPLPKPDHIPKKIEAQADKQINDNQDNSEAKHSPARAPSGITDLEDSFARFSEFCPKRVLRLLKKRREANRASAKLSQKEVELLLGSQFANIALKSEIVQRAFREYIDANSSIDSIQAWLSSDPLLGPSERNFLMMALLIYEREISAKLATVSKTFSRAKKILADVDPKVVSAFEGSFERATSEWEFVSLLLANLMGFPEDFDRITKIMASELYRDRVGDMEIALLSQNWAEAHKILLSAVKNNLMISADPGRIEPLKRQLKAMNSDDLSLEEISVITDMSKKLLHDTRHIVAQQVIPNILEADVGDELNEVAKKRLMIRLQGPYRGHYLSNNDIDTMNKVYYANEKVVAILAQPSMSDRDRMVIRYHLLGSLRKTCSRETRERIIRLIYRLYMPVSY